MPEDSIGPPGRILEACLYVNDLEAAERFYTTVLKLNLYAKVENRHVFFKCGNAMFLLFQPDETAKKNSAFDVPSHGATGPGHAAFAVAESELPAWRRQLQASGVKIESEVEWPGGGRSIYFRDPANNSVELATPSLWGFED